MKHRNRPLALLLAAALALSMTLTAFAEENSGADPFDSNNSNHSSGSDDFSDPADTTGDPFDSSDFSDPADTTGDPFGSSDSSGSGDPVDSAGDPAGSDDPTGTAGDPAGSSDPAGTAGDPAGSDDPAGTAGDPAGSDDPAGTAGDPAGSDDPAGTVGDPAGSSDPAGTAMNYTDVTSANWYYDAVAFVTENGLMDGKDETAFAPGEDMTRQMLANALYRLAGSPEVTAENPFADVADDAAYKDAVVWAYTKGIVTGVDATTFNPDSPIQRQAIAAMLARYAGVDAEDENGLNAFTDADAIQSYARGPMSWAAANGLVKGNPDGTVNPRGNATRAQVAAILQRFAPLTVEVPTHDEGNEGIDPGESGVPEGSAEADPAAGTDPADA